MAALKIGNYVGTFYFVMLNTPTPVL